MFRWNFMEMHIIIWGARVAQWVRSLDLTAYTNLSPIWRVFVPSFVNYKKGCTRLAAASDKVYQLLSHSQWFSPGTSASSTTKTGRHDIAEILPKVALNTKNQQKNQIIIIWVQSKMYKPEPFVSITSDLVTISVNFYNFDLSNSNLTCLIPN